jgi:hypothetical protein
MVGMVVKEEPAELVGMVEKVGPVVKGKHDSPRSSSELRSFGFLDTHESFHLCRRECMGSEANARLCRVASLFLARERRFRSLRLQ